IETLLFVKGYYLLATIVCLALSSALADITEGIYNVNEACTLVKTGTKLGSIESCDYYYLCSPSGPVKTSCSEGYSYNYKKATCLPSEQVSCFYGLENPCEGKIGNNWVPDVNNCQGWYYCNDDAIANKGACGKGQKFEGTTQKCVYATCQSNDLAEAVMDYCDVMPTGVYFGNTDNCKEWIICDENAVASQGKCETSAFVASTGMCGYDVTPGACDRVTVPKAPETCTNDGDVEPDAAVCGNYYECKEEEFVLKKCDTGFYFDVTDGTCVERQLATPVETCDRCQDANLEFVNAVDGEHCTKYYYCRDGKKASEYECKDKRFFDETRQGC
ncbi:hypothetical protein KR044_012583, partial [Drosophila immigrans]